MTSSKEKINIDVRLSTLHRSYVRGIISKEQYEKELQEIHKEKNT